MLQAERHRIADLKLRGMVQSKKETIDTYIEWSSSDDVSEPSDGAQGCEMTDDSSDTKSDTMSVDSDRTFFKFQKELVIKRLYQEPKA